MSFDTIEKVLDVTLILVRNGVYSYTSIKAYKQVKKFGKPDEYKSRKQYYGDANRYQKYRKPDEYKSRKQYYGDANRYQKYRKPDEYKSRKQYYGDANRYQKYRKPDKHKSRKLYNGGANTENLTSTSLEDNNTAAITGRKSSRKSTADEYPITNLCLEEIFAKFLCRKQFPICLPLLSCVCVVFLQPNRSWRLPLAWRITFQDCIAEKPTSYGAARRDVPINLDQNAMFNGKNNGTAYANPELHMKIQWQILARQRADMGLHSQRAIQTKECERQTQRNISWETKECGRGFKGNRCAEQNKAIG